MRMKWTQALVAAVVLAVPGFAAAQAKGTPAAAPEAPSVRPFDFSGSFFRTFSTSTTGNGTVQSPVDNYGGMVGGRYIKGPWAGLEVTYSFNPENQQYKVDPANCNFQCSNQPVTITGTISQVSVDYVASRKMGKITPFAIGGLGFVINVATGNEYSINTIVRPGYIAGAGADFALSPRFGLRVQFRDTISKAPQLTAGYFTTGKFMQTAEPMFGVYFRPW